MHATTQVIERNAQTFSEYKSLLVFNPPEGEPLGFVDVAAAVTFDYRVYRSLAGLLGDKAHFSCEPLSDQTFDCAVIFLPKAKEELALVLAYVAPMLDANASLYLVGEKKAGIASAAKKLDALGENASKLDSAKHCQLWHVTLSAQLPAFKLDDWMSDYPVTVGETTLSIVTIPGVFSFGRLDHGTDMLLSHVPTNLSGRILDFGCGAGVIGAYALSTNATILLECVDINLLAIECTKATLAKNALQGSVYPSDGWSDVEGRVQGVLTNPPFHSGVKTEYLTTECFIQGALDKMSKHAKMWLVANSFLKYAPIMERSFGAYTTVDENSKFRLYRVSR